MENRNCISLCRHVLFFVYFIIILISSISTAPYKQGWTSLEDYEMGNDVISSDPWIDQWQQRKHRPATDDWLSDYNAMPDYDMSDSSLASSHRSRETSQHAALDWRTIGQGVALPAVNHVMMNEHALVARKRSPACIKRCVEQGALHPIQCHSLC